MPQLAFGLAMSFEDGAAEHMDWQQHATILLSLGSLTMEVSFEFISVNRTAKSILGERACLSRLERNFAWKSRT